MRKSIWLMVLIGSWCGFASAYAETPEAASVKVDHFKIAASMLSDAQNWTDRQIQSDCRLQNRVGTEQWRVLSPGERVHFKGSIEQCKTRLNRLLDGKQPERLQGAVVVLVHGLFQTRAKMETLETHLEKSGKLKVINFGYASTRADVSEHAAALEEVLQCVEPGTTVSFVGHSMGCIVIRGLLARHEKKEWKPGRVVMIAPPNQGAEMARRFSEVRMVRTWLGPGFEQLADPKLNDLSSFQSPPCEFAVIAGASPRWLLNSPFIEGDDDWIVGIQETKLTGAKSQTCVDSHHGNIVHDPRVLALTSDFLLHGEFDISSRQEGK
jgi:pimeloyl-ACP methyl ester carboxylesterase